MKHKEIFERAAANEAVAREVLNESRVVDVWRTAGCRVNLVGSLRMGLLASHRDIDLHVYSQGVTTEGSFGIMSEIAKNRNVAEIKCINGLHTEERCIAWHVSYRAADGAMWQIDIIHIEEGSEYDGFFERMADRIEAVMTPEQRELILSLKFETQAECGFHGVEYYEAVIADGVKSVAELKDWVAAHRQRPQYYWIP
ncbi:MAG: phosphoglycerate mutase family protein [Bacteroides sp.]|nr:phosphoglycerate mutase family protein [Bacteroides sp.]